MNLKILVYFNWIDYKEFWVHILKLWKNFVSCKYVNFFLWVFKMTSLFIFWNCFTVCGCQKKLISSSKRILKLLLRIFCNFNFSVSIFEVKRRVHFLNFFYNFKRFVGNQFYFICLLQTTKHGHFNPASIV